MTASETAPDLNPRPDYERLRPPTEGDRDPPVGPRRLLFGAVLVGLGLLVGGVTPWLGGGENVVAARMGFAILLLIVGLVVVARRPSLAAGGLAALLGLFLHANPYYGDRSADWPWQSWLSSGFLHHQVDIALWVGAAVLALLRAYLGRGRGILVGALLLVLMSVVRTHAEGGGMPLLRNEEHLDLSWSLTIGSLGTAAMLFARGSPGGRKPAVTLTVLGVLLAATIYLAWFPGATGMSMAQINYWRAGRAWDTLVASAEASPQFREGVLKDVFGRIAPFWCMVAALPALLLASLSGRLPRLSRILGAVAFGLLLLRWLVPAFAELYFQRDFLRVRGPTLVCAIVGDALTGAGLAAWILLSATASLLLAFGRVGRREPTLPTAETALRPISRVPYGVALGLLLVGLYAAFNPHNGTVFPAWPWGVPWDPFWNQPSAGLVLGGLSIVALAAAVLSRPGRLRAVLALGGLLVSMAALAELYQSAYLYSVRPFVPPVLLALLVAGAVAVRGGRGGLFPKAVTWAAGLFLLALLFYPMPSVERGGADTLGYRSMLGGLVVSLRNMESFKDRWEFMTSTYNPGLIVLTVGVLVLATFTACRPGRRPIALWVLFFVTLLYPALHTSFRLAADPLSRVGDPIQVFLQRLAQDLGVYYVPHALGIAAAGADLLLSRKVVPRSAPALGG